MVDVLMPRAAGKFIADNAIDVKISIDKVKELAAMVLSSFKEHKFSLSDWKLNEINPQSADINAINWIFLVDTLNFSFWTEDHLYTVTYKDKSYNGYFSMCAAVQRALEEGIPITDPDYYCRVTREELQNIFRSDSGIEIPLLDERLELLHETGKILSKNYSSSFSTCIQQCDKKAQKLLEIIVNNFPCYRDEAIYNGQKVGIYKRAQILIADIWACFEGKDFGEFHDIDTLTMFADYRVPQVLAYFGVLQYSDNLFERLNNDELMQNKDRQEVEIRGCAIWAVELLVNELQILASTCTENVCTIVNSIVVDFFLWEYRRRHAKHIDKIPFHKVRCIFY